MKKYPEYKDTGDIWFKEIPSNWDFTKLGYHSRMIVPMRDKPKELNGDVPWLRIEDFNGKYVSNSKSHQGVTTETIENMNLKVFPIGTVLCSCSCNMGKTAIVKKPLITNQTFIGIVPNGISSDYLFYLMSASEELLNSLGTGAIQSYLSREDFEKFKIPLPSITEQTVIANFLDLKTQQIDDLIERKKRLIELLKEERTAVINQAVTKGLDPDVPMKDSGIEWLGEIPKHWETRRLATMGRFSKGRGISRDEIVDDGIPCIRYGEIYTQYDRIVRHPISRITEESSKKSEKIQKGDVLFTASGETIEDIGKSIVYYGDQDIYVGGDIIILKLYPNISPLFMSFSLESNYAVQQKASFGKGGIIVHIYAKQLREIFVPFPPIIEQEKIAEFLEMRTNQIDEQIRLLKDEIELFAEYKTSLINEAVTGKIKVPDAD